MWSPNQSSGFTLIELLIATGLSLLLMGGAIATYNNFLAQRTRSDTSKLVISRLQEAQNRSISGDTPDSCTTLNGYRVWAQQNTQQYSVAARCDSSPTNVEAESFTLSENEFFRTGFDVTFLPRPGVLLGAPVTVQIGSLDSAVNLFEFEILNNGVIDDRGLQFE